MEKSDGRANSCERQGGVAKSRFKGAEAACAISQHVSFICRNIAVENSSSPVPRREGYADTLSLLGRKSLIRSNHMSGALQPARLGRVERN